MRHHLRAISLAVAKLASHPAVATANAVAVVATIKAEVSQWADDVVKELEKDLKYGTPLALGVTFNICTVESLHSDTCRLEIAAAGGVITPDQHGAYWPGNQ
jgi:hypothetical protein